jgi:hypothetical protein
MVHIKIGLSGQKENKHERSRKEQVVKGGT